ncbi:ThiF family adenylyltransferase [Burkholderia cenocepacia]|uniref:ThiF family adenylyltransferase n=1 Tax=Burkholderia cenocepacia TaxID=95486 RepID=UPI002ABDD544|nr:ThiF family adenylyltransferase [Burkholderia cenocepacia]
MHEAVTEPIAPAVIQSPTFGCLAGRWPGTLEVDSATLARLYPGRRFSCGWRIPGEELGLPEPLIVALEREHAFQVPRVAVSRRPEPCEIPHLESDGVFCLLPSSTPVRLPVTGELAVHLVEQAVRAYLDAQAGANRTDFLDEFQTYWTLSNSAMRDVFAWLSDFTQTRTVYTANMGKSVMVADSADGIEDWFKKRGCPVKRRDIRKATFVRLREPLYPVDYPSNSAELLGLLRDRCPESLEPVLSSIRMDEDIVIVWCFEHDGQPVMGATLTPVLQRFPHPLNRGQAFLSGRNRWRVPVELLHARLVQARFPTSRAAVVRADSDFLVERTTGKVDGAVRKLKVVIIGCGALGATTALLLAQAGIREMTLVDGDLLTYQNIGRHSLGAQYIGWNKAEALRDEICARYVDYTVHAVAHRWQRAYEDNPRSFEKADLVISATGDWLSEAELNDLLEKGDVPPTIFTWLERFGVAGHATFVPANASLLWALNEYGEALRQVAKVPGDMPREAACGAFYQPFSSAASAEVAAMTVRLALAVATGEITTGQEWTWIGTYENLLRAGAEILPFWRRHVFDGDGFQKVYRNQLEAPSKEAGPAQ